MVQAQQVLTVKDYQQAESMLSYNTDRYIDRTVSAMNWMEGDKLTYKALTPDGAEFYLVDAVKGTRSLAFDHAKLAAALSKETGKTYTAATLPFASFSYSSDMKSIRFRVGGTAYAADLQTYAVTKDTGSNTGDGGGGFAGRRRGGGSSVLSPDGSKAAFIKEYNLWVRDVKSGTETQLTTDGIKDFGYATDNAGWSHSDGAVLRWSPDSKKLQPFNKTNAM